MVWVEKLDVFITIYCEGGFQYILQWDFSYQRWIIVDTPHFTSGIWKNPLRPESGFQFQIHFLAERDISKAHK